MQKLSISFQTFLNVRSKNRIYVDKTMFVHRVLQEGGGFFWLVRVGLANHCFSPRCKNSRRATVRSFLGFG
jgi:hypothetical protein